MDDNQGKTCICTSRWLDNIVLSEQGGWSPTYGQDMPWRNGKNWVLNQEILGCQVVSPPHTIFPHSEMEDVGFSQRFTNCFLNFWSLLIFLIVAKSFLFSWNSYLTTLPRKSQWPDLPWVNCGLSLHIATKWVNPRKWIISHCWPCREPGDV